MIEQQLVNGIALGSVYALVAVAFTLASDPESKRVPPLFTFDPSYLRGGKHVSELRSATR